eukprot:403349009
MPLIRGQLKQRTLVDLICELTEEKLVSIQKESPYQLRKISMIFYNSHKAPILKVKKKQ